jgi:hypothetical protein
VTLRTVLDEQAVTVGTTFAELLAAGFAFERALSLARAEIITNRDYAVVGDGSHRLRPPRGTPAVLRIEPVDGGFRLGCDALAPDSAGRRYRDPVTGTERACCAPATMTLPRDELIDVLRLVSLPVYYDGSFARSEAVVRDIAAPHYP